MENEQKREEQVKRSQEARINKQALTDEEREDIKIGLLETNLKVDVIASEIVGLRCQTMNIESALESKIAAVKDELRSLEYDLERKISLRQLESLLTRKSETFKRLELNVKAMKYQLGE